MTYLVVPTAACSPAPTKMTSCTVLKAKTRYTALAVQTRSSEGTATTSSTGATATRGKGYSEAEARMSSMAGVAMISWTQTGRGGIDSIAAKVGTTTTPIRTTT